MLPTVAHVCPELPSSVDSRSFAFQRYARWFDSVTKRAPGSALLNKDAPSESVAAVATMIPLDVAKGSLP